ncbi:hypothetical protein SAMN02799631_05183 [Methylobacterium sp. 174MFSha1.1]|uniref:hypothetical protein n=1 Tax=Methylobacterium sp. 174MFSha1.1 TaxID=1502749 RepID=UPI0008F1FFA9|nr:hypothetical protein [Methylobacterium sp. 174MFSha1.1]SFV11005.1 hypothetical protein SAMN02799631_05183 [Methylobacterium sp. 174MFSha1.1]
MLRKTTPFDQLANTFFHDAKDTVRYASNLPTAGFEEMWQSEVGVWLDRAEMKGWHGDMHYAPTRRERIRLLDALGHWNFALILTAYDVMVQCGSEQTLLPCYETLITGFLAEVREIDRSLSILLAKVISYQPVTID